MAAEAGFELIMKHKDGSTTVLPDALFKNFAALVLAEHRSQGEEAAHGEADRLLDEYMAACARSDVEARDQARAAVRAAFARASVTPEGGAEAWMHEDDPARVISAIQKSQAEKDGGASASSVKAYSIRLNKHQPKAQGATAEDWVSAIAPLMPADFKDWHQNSPNEWPRVTAEVIRALRESEAFWIEQAGKPKAQPKGTAIPDSFFPGMDEDYRREAWRIRQGVKQSLQSPAPVDDFAAHTVLSGVARRKVADMIASGYRICGYTMERQGHRSAVVFDAAWRWLDDEQRHTLMFVEGSRVQAPAVTHGSDMLEPLIYAAMMHNGKPKTVAEFERVAANVADMLQRRAADAHEKPVASIYISADGSREFDDWRVDLPPGNHQLFTAPRPDQPQPESLPHPGAPEAEEMIEKLLAECNRPSNMKNAARAGYMAAKRLLQHARQPLPATDDAEPNVQPKHTAEPVAWIRWEWNRSGGKSLEFFKPDELSLSDQARGVVYDPLYAQAPAPAPSAARLTQDGKLHVTAWECHGCGHRGIDDGDDAAEACSDCNWRGPCPDEDVCPGCGREGTMVSACPKCGDRYYIKAEADIVIPTAAQAPAVEQLIPQGFRVEHCAPSGALTDEANARTKWVVERTEAPYTGRDRLRKWTGPTLADAMRAARESLPADLVYDVPVHGTGGGNG